MKLTISVLILALLLTGCGKNPSEPDNHSTVVYTLDSSGCFQSAQQYDDYSEFTMDKYKAKTFTWYCADYKTYHNAYVSIDFDNGNNGGICLKLSNVYVSGGICD